MNVLLNLWSKEITEFIIPRFQILKSRGHHQWACAHSAAPWRMSLARGSCTTWKIRFFRLFFLLQDDDDDDDGPVLYD